MSKVLPDIPTGKQISDHVKQHVQDALDERELNNQYNPSPIPYHIHNGTDSPIITGLIGPQGNPGTNGTSSIQPEHDNGNLTGTATIDWSVSNFQYLTLTGDCTFTFSNPVSGGRYILQVAGAHTPTWPSNVRWVGQTTPIPTATAGVKDIYAFIYSTKDALYDGIPSTNYLTT